jgi:hypothetical protein
MHRIHRTNRRGPLTALAALLLASLLLAACGSSSTTTASTAASKTASGAAAAGRFAAVRECLKKAGITLPKRGTGTPGGGRPPGGFGLGGGGGPTLPNGVTREQLQSALRKCGGSSGGSARFGRSRLSSSSYRKALASFAACMTQNGVKLPAPNTTGTGPVFNTSGLNINSPKFVAARAKCSSLLRVGPGAAGPRGLPAPGAAAPGA